MNDWQYISLAAFGTIIYTAAQMWWLAAMYAGCLTFMSYAVWRRNN